MATTFFKPNPPNQLGVDLGGGIAASKEPTPADADTGATGSKPEPEPGAGRRGLASEDKQRSEGRRSQKVNKGNKSKKKTIYRQARGTSSSSSFSSRIIRSSSAP